MATPDRNAVATRPRPGPPSCSDRCGLGILPASRHVNIPLFCALADPDVLEACRDPTWYDNPRPRQNWYHADGSVRYSAPVPEPLDVQTLGQTWRRFLAALDWAAPFAHVRFDLSMPRCAHLDERSHWAVVGLGDGHYATVSGQALGSLVLGLATAIRMRARGGEVHFELVHEGPAGEALRQRLAQMCNARPCQTRPGVGCVLSRRTVESRPYLRLEPSPEPGRDRRRFV